MDKATVHATEDFVHAGYPLDVDGLMIIELDGPSAEVDYLVGSRPRDCRTQQCQHRQDRRQRRRACAILVRAEERVSGDWADIPRLHLR